MNKTEMLHVRCTDETKAQLRAVAERTGMKETDVMRGLIGKAFRDEVLCQLLRKYWDMQRGGFNATSYNARYDDNEKNGSLGTSEPRNVDSHPVSSQPNYSRWDADIERTIEIAKAKWVTD